MARAFKLALSAAALVLAALFALHHVWRGVQSGAGDWTAGDQQLSAPSEARRVLWGAAERAALLDDRWAAASRVALSQDGRWAVVAAGERGADAGLWLLELDGLRPLRERHLAELDAPGDEVAPCFDGSMLWFASDRAGGAGGLDLWRARFENGRCAEPTWTGPDLNSARDDSEPAVRGSEVVFVSDRDGAPALWVAGGAGEAPRRWPGVDAAVDLRAPAFSPDGASLWCAHARSGELWRAFRSAERWLPAAPVAGLGGDARSPCPLPSGFEILWLGGDGTSWRARSIEYGVVPFPPWTLAELLLLASLLALALLAWLARDRPAWDTLLLCWAVSVLVHLLLFLWMESVRLRGADLDAGRPHGDPIRIQLRDRSDAQLAGARAPRTPRLERTALARAPADASLDPGFTLRAAIQASTAGAPAAPARGAERAPVPALARLAEPSSAQIPRAPAEPVAELGPLPANSPRATAARTEPARWRATPAEDGGSDALAVPAAASLADELAPVPAAPTSAPGRAPLTPSVGAGAEFARAAAADPARDEALAPAAESALPAPPEPERRALAAGQGLPERWSARVQGDDAPFEPRAAAAPLLAAPARERDEALAPERERSTPYSARSGPRKQLALEELGGTPETEAAVARGLAYLARIQGRLGAWGPVGERDEKYGEVCVGKTGLCALAFLAAGHTHLSATEHTRVVERALAFLLATQDPATGHFGDTSAYSHGIATFALAEALAMTGDPTLRAAVRRGVDHLLANQIEGTDPRSAGGWPYYYADGRTFDAWPRTSITVWQVMALESARLSGVDVPDAALAAAERFLDHARDPRAPWYRYNHDPARLRSAYPTLPASTPAALFALACLGRDLGTDEHAPARAFVLERAPRGYRFTSERAFVERGQGNPYFWYHGTLAMLRVGGDAWKRWNAALQETLLPAQEADGSWKPIDVYARYARDTDRDRSYTTALCVLSLEVYYRYDLPLLAARARRER